MTRRTVDIATHDDIARRVLQRLTRDRDDRGSGSPTLDGVDFSTGLVS